MPDNLYWEKRYQRGETSGRDSNYMARILELELIEKYAGKIDDVVDVGCGDLLFWKDKTCKEYTGIDISQCIIDQNKKERPNWKFICSPAEIYHSGVKGRIVLCIDVLIHILDEKVYQAILNNLMLYSTEWIFIHTWFKNPFYSFKYRYNLFRIRRFKTLVRSLIHQLDTDNLYQKYRDFSRYRPLFERKNFRLKAVEKNALISKEGALFVFHLEST